MTGLILNNYLTHGERLWRSFATASRMPRTGYGDLFRLRRVLVSSWMDWQYIDDDATSDETEIVAYLQSDMENMRDFFAPYHTIYDEESWLPTEVQERVLYQYAVDERDPDERVDSEGWGNDD